LAARPRGQPVVPDAAPVPPAPAQRLGRRVCADVRGVVEGDGRAPPRGRRLNREGTMTLLYTDPLFLAHETSNHPERPARLRAIDARLRKAGLVERCTVVTTTPATEDEVRGVHDPAVVDRVRESARSGGGWLDADTFVSPASFEVALAAAGACC